MDSQLTSALTHFIYSASKISADLAQFADNRRCASYPRGSGDEAVCLWPGKRSGSGPADLSRRHLSAVKLGAFLPDIRLMLGRSRSGSIKIS